MADNRKLTAGLLKMPESQRQDLARIGEEYKRFQEADYLRKMGEQGVGLAKSVARGVPQMATGLVDLAAMPFEAAGVLQPGQAVGSTKWLESKGYLPEQQEGFANQLTELLSGGFDPSDLVTKGLPALGMIGKTVWHGSPHTFDKFDISKIGTGEGAQAYGHGLYLADAPTTAETYKTAGTFQHPQISIDGTPYVASSVLNNGTPYNLAADAYSRFGNKKDAINWLDDFGSGLEARKILKKAKNIEDVTGNQGNLYKVDLPDEQIAKMLDWDKLLSEQNEYVQQAIRSQMPDTSWDVMKNRRGQDYYEHYWNAGIGGSGQNRWASQSLEDLGIPGIQYLDQASRGAGEGTRNYVVFSDEIPQILERNGQPVAQALRNYGLEHRPMTIEGGASQLHELTPSFGEDVYGKQAMQYFGSGDPREKKALEIMKSVRGNPDAPVTIYRGVPEGVNQINQGDWVTIVPEVAADYGNVISQQVPASHITSWPDSLMEFGYYPPKAK